MRGSHGRPVFMYFYGPVEIDISIDNNVVVGIE
jgi:hypothetical protein